MTRSRHAHALVRHARGDRIPGAHRAAFRLAAVATALAAMTSATAPPATAYAASARGGRPAARADAREAQPVSPARNHRLIRAVTLSAHGGRPASKRAGAPAGRDSAGITPPFRRARTRSAPQRHSAPETVPAAGATPPPWPDSPGPADLSAPEQDAAPPDEPEEPPKSLRLSQEFAELTLRGNGIRWRSTGGCSDRTVAACTSFDGIRWGTLKGLLDFAESSGCKITVTGGTERGHASGPYSHANGYKLDIAPGRCVNAAIKRYPSQGTRGDGARLHRSPDGAVFAREKDHWDITFR
ncbi:hypothetical protein [Actinomadura sp. GTD37]|uniref:hypothetical protein n=1 Tax=Actinomadura sp. GTD37 TaxID=1778030 RepID=UPI0035C0DCD2